MDTGLNRFVDAQEFSYEVAFKELQHGKKRSHWMWFIFPQFTGLGFSATSQLYAIKTLDEAKAYAEHSLLGARLREITKFLIESSSDDAKAIFGPTDSKKFRSCMTLFYIATRDEIFKTALNKFFNGEMCEYTLAATNSTNIK